MDNQSRFEVSFILLLLCVRSFLFEITYLFVLIEINLALANVASRIVLSVVFKLSYALGPLVWSWAPRREIAWYLFCSASYSAVFEIKEIPVWEGGPRSTGWTGSWCQTGRGVWLQRPASKSPKTSSADLRKQESQDYSVLKPNGTLEESLSWHFYFTSNYTEGERAYQGHKANCKRKVY